MQFTDSTYGRLRDLLNQRIGLAYPERKRADLELGLGHVCRAADLDSFEQLYERLLRDDKLWDALIAHLTIGETYFFRHSSQFAMLRQHLLPEIIARRAPIRTLRIWSAGCATGEEPYSVAMLVAEQPELGPDWQTTILATDINPVFLARAQEARYGAWSFRETTDAQRAQFFQAEGQRWQLNPEIRRMVRFARLNLAEDSYPAIATNTCAIDVIICRNVTIYFDEATTQRVINQFYEALTPGGWLIVGHSEPQVRLYHRFEVHNFPDTVVYRKPLQAPLSADPLTSPFSPPAARMAQPGTWAPPPQFGAHHQPNLFAPAPWAATPAGGDSPLRSESPAARLTLLLSRASQSADQGDLAAARTQCQALLESAPLLVAGHFLLGQIEEQAGEIDAALSAYRRTVFLDRQFTMGILGMARCWQRLGDSGEARRCYRNALKQAAALPPAVLMECGDGATAGEVAAYCRAQVAAVKG